MTTLGGPVGSSPTNTNLQGTVLGGIPKKTSEAKKIKKQSNEDIPELVSCVGSENRKDILEPYIKMNDIDCFDKEEDATEENSLAEWGISVTFSKPFTELELWNHFRILFIPELRMKKTAFPSTIYAMSRLYDKSIKNQLSDEEEYDGFPIFENTELLENLYNNQTKTNKGKGKKGSSKKDLKITSRARNQKFSELYIWVHLFKVADFDNEEENEEEEYEKKRNNIEPELLEKDDLENLIQLIKLICDKFDPQAKVGYGKTPEEAALFAEKIVSMIEFCDQYVCIELEGDKSKGGFSITQVWDVMMSIGLEFEPNRNEFVLPQANFLNVATSTVPGFNSAYFTNSNYSVSTLLFNLYIPHCKFPEKTVEGIYEVVLYVQSRLGGKILDHNRNEISTKDQLKDLLNEVKEISNAMTKCNISPASVQAFQLFY